MITERWSLAQQIVLITGATQGIGKAIAEEFLKLKAEVIITARNNTKLTQTVQTWSEAGYAAHGFNYDVTKLEERQQCVMAIEKRWGKLNVLINNVGPNFKKHFFDYPLAEYQKLIDENMTTTFHLTQLCYPLLAAANSASIINISGVSSQKAFSGSGPYGMAKAAIESFARTLAIELGQQNIRANAILPGFTATPTFLQKYDANYLQKATAKIPLGRLGDATDIAGLACFLAIPVSAYITGQCIVVDGGFTHYGF